MNFTALHELKYHEGVRKKPYLDSVMLWTTGVGHLIAPKAHLEMTFVQRKAAKAAGLLHCPEEWNRGLTNAEVDEILTYDLGRFERGVLRLCPVGLTQGRYNALVSFAFNAGLGRLQTSSIRTKHNRGDFGGASEAFLLYRMAGGMVQKGLVTRRKDEQAMYLS